MPGGASWKPQVLAGALPPNKAAHHGNRGLAGTAEGKAVPPIETPPAVVSFVPNFLLWGHTFFIFQFLAVYANSIISCYSVFLFQGINAE